MQLNMSNLILERLHSHVYTLFSVTLLFIETVLLEVTYFDAKHFIYHQNRHLWLWDKGALCILTYRLTNSGGRTLKIQHHPGAQVCASFIHLPGFLPHKHLILFSYLWFILSFSLYLRLRSLGW